MCIRDRPVTEPIAIAKAALVFEAERQVEPSIISANDGNFLAKHGPVVVTFLFEEDLKSSSDLWTSYQQADEVQREAILRKVATQNIVLDNKDGEVFRMLKARAQSESPSIPVE